MDHMAASKWKKMKYEWLPFQVFTPQELEQAIDQLHVSVFSQKIRELNVNYALTQIG